MIKKMNETEQKIYVQESNLRKGTIWGLLLSMPLWFIIIFTIYIF